MGEDLVRQQQKKQEELEHLAKELTVEVTLEVEGRQLTLPLGGMLFDGLTATEPADVVRIATDLLPVRVVVGGLKEGQRRLVLPVAQVGYIGKIYVEKGIRLQTGVMEALGPERVRQLPEDPAEWQDFLQREGTPRPFILVDDSTGQKRSLLPESALVLNLSAELARRLSLLQLANLEAALRRHGHLARLERLLERDWKGELDIYDVAA